VNFDLSNFDKRDYPLPMDVQPDDQNAASADAVDSASPAAAAETPAAAATAQTPAAVHAPAATGASVGKAVGVPVPPSLSGTKRRGSSSKPLGQATIIKYSSEILIKYSSEQQLLNIVVSNPPRIRSATIPHVILSADNQRVDGYNVIRIEREGVETLREIEAELLSHV
jgi:hypothetical protein